MEIVLWTSVYLSTFFAMEFVAWFSHKYIMHGFLWVWHKDHHKKEHDSWFEMNDLFFVVYALMSFGFVVLYNEFGQWYGLPIALGIFHLWTHVFFSTRYLYPPAV